MTEIAVDPFETLARAVGAVQHDLADLRGTLLAQIAAHAPTSATAAVATSESTTSLPYTDLATIGPSVTLTTGTKALVVISCNLRNATSLAYSYMAFAISGASTLSPGSGLVLQHQSAAAAGEFSGSAAYLVTGLTAGSNTFTAKYAVGSGTGTFANRRIVVIDMGS